MNVDELLNNFHCEIDYCRTKNDYRLLKIKYLKKIKNLSEKDQEFIKEEMNETIKFSQ